MRNTRLGKVFLARVLTGTAIATGTSLALAAPAFAQGGEVSLNVKAGPLSTALNDFASQTGYQLLYPSDLVAGKTSGGASGAQSVSDGLRRVLAGTGLGFTLLDGKTIQISAPNTGDGEVVTGAVNVEGVQGSPWFGGAGQAAGVNGVNGSRDITATEGTGSFTSGALTIGSKVPQALKDLPQTISVLTDERLKQQNVTDFTTAMRQLPGVTLVQGATGLENTFYSRGYAVTSIQVDGGAPLSTLHGFYPQIDMAQYDHVEMLRGATGTFSGYGTPSGSVNLVRKKPLDHSQFSIEAQAGSWQNYRIVADATSPLALDGKLRGRLVMTYQDNHYFYDTAKNNKTLIYGVTELDATPTTLVTAGISYTRQNAVPWYGGMPRYQNGDDLELPRNTSFVFPWNRWDFDTTELFGGIRQKIGSEWTANLDVTRNRQTSFQELGTSNGTVNPLSGAGPTLSGVYNNYSSTQLSTEATLTGAFTVFGQHQEVTFGVNRVDTDGGGQILYRPLITGTLTQPYVPYPGGPAYYSGSPNGSAPAINVFDFDPNNPLYTEPRAPLASGRRLSSGTVQSVAYMNLRLTAFDRLHLTTGLRWSRYAYKQSTVSLCYSIPTSGTPSDFNCVGRQIGDEYSPNQSNFNDTDISWPPSGSLSYDITNQLTGYVGYTDIYESQPDTLDGDLNPVHPVTGSNIEAGLKWAARGGRLNISIAAYRIREKGFAQFDQSRVVVDEITGETFVLANKGNRILGGTVDANHACCFYSDPNQTNKSDGIDFDATGEIRPGWQFSASYSYNRNKYDGSTTGANEGLPLVTIAPRHIYKLWTSFDFEAAGAAGWLSGLTLSGGLNGQSAGYRSGTTCINLNPPNSMGISTCKSSGKPDTVPFQYWVYAYAIVSGRIDYRFSDKWSLAVNLDNILDKTYYTNDGISGGNWYGAPRSFTATLRAKW
ncbi:MAG: TonB-dependent receptor [Candidatus Andeanibacterium colombiense]|uniref:TonB-dependent receptor n=1 Tax=Candidatus Andeanibacterium colombiense TaxID=3121345 RepID=A0AAJ6BQM3_9SPHN|nr:MAG: TonB-dependent receptor [Sphingomonadaceae bacterium]